jgi:hypothetical protein
LDEQLGLKCYTLADDLEEDALWEGDKITDRAATQADNRMAQHTRLMFLNIRHFKADIEGWILRDDLWDFATRWDMDWVGLSDHCLQAPPGPGGKWDRSGSGVHQNHRYRASGVQAAAAKGYKEEGWGGERMTWAFQQGLDGTSGPVGGTLLASRFFFNTGPVSLFK